MIATRTRRDPARWSAVALAAVVLMVAAGVARAELPRLQSDGTRVVDADGAPVVLRGVNVGNWLVLETWMAAWPQPDQAAVYATLDRRFGEGERRALMETWREGYVAPRDLEIIKRFGLNVVRVPFDDRLLAEGGGDDDAAFRWLDRALAMAESAGLYVVLDLHGAPGGQSDQHHTGEGGRDGLWDSPADQDATVALWRRVAERYKGRSVVAAYDLLNEPWSDGRRDVRPQLKSIALRCLAAVRDAGDDHLVLLPGSLQDGPLFYGNLRAELGDAAMRNVGFTHHFYPGLFGSPGTAESHARALSITFPAVAAYLDAQRAPFLVGEFNAVLDSTGGDRVTRRYYDEFARRGWMATAWSYKLLKPAAGVEGSNWYFATNADPLPPLDVETASLAEVRRWFADLATMPLAVDEDLLAALTDPTPAPPALPPVDDFPDAVPATALPDAWAMFNVGGAAAGAVATPADGGGLRVDVTAGGRDIFGTRDDFALVARRLADAPVLTATVAELLPTDRYAKAGLMVRGGADPTSPAAPFVMLHAFPDGSVALTTRRAEGAAATERKCHPGPLPVTLRLARDGGVVTALIRQGDAWYVAGRVELDGLGDGSLIGLAACAHSDWLLTRARFEVDAAGDDAAVAAVEHLRPPTPDGPNLLANPSFQAAGDRPVDAAGWNRWGEWIDRETAWSPTRTGTAMIGYHHWQTDGPGDSGLWQDVRVEPGGRYRFAVFASADAPDGGATPSSRLTLTIEATIDGKQVALASREASPADLEPAGGWSLVAVDAVAPTDALRVLVRLAPSPDGRRGGAVKLDDAVLVRLP